VRAAVLRAADTGSDHRGARPLAVGSGDRYAAMLSADRRVHVDRARGDGRPHRVLHASLAEGERVARVDFRAALRPCVVCRLGLRFLARHPVARGLHGRPLVRGWLAGNHLLMAVVVSPIVRLERFWFSPRRFSTPASRREMVLSICA